METTKEERAEWLTTEWWPDDTCEEVHRLCRDVDRLEEQRNAAMAGFSSRSQDYHAVAHPGFYTKCQHPLCTGDRAGVDRWVRQRAAPEKEEQK